MNEPILLEIKEIINKSISEFEDTYDYRVDMGARDLLEKPLHNHPNEIIESISVGLYKSSDIHQAILEILKNSITFRSLEKFIDSHAIKNSMSFYCPILFWC